MHVNSRPRLGLGQLVHLQFPAEKGFNLGLRKSLDMWAAYANITTVIGQRSYKFINLKFKYIYK